MVCETRCAKRLRLFNAGLNKDDLGAQLAAPPPLAQQACSKSPTLAQPACSESHTLAQQACSESPPSLSEHAPPLAREVSCPAPLTEYVDAAPAQGGSGCSSSSSTAQFCSSAEQPGSSTEQARRRDLTPEFEECISMMDTLSRAKLLKMRDVSKTVGLPVKEILDKIRDRTLNPVHLRKVREYLKDIVQIGNDLAGAMRHKLSGVPRACPAAGRVVGCPLNAMGYVGLECTETMPESEVVQHIACHVATLWKRVEELETRQDAFLLRSDGFVAVV